MAEPIPTDTPTADYRCGYRNTPHGAHRFQNAFGVIDCPGNLPAVAPNLGEPGSNVGDDLPEAVYLDAALIHQRGRVAGVVAHAREPEFRAAVESVWRAARAGLAAEVREQVAQEIIAHADQWAPRDGNRDQLRMRRHLMIAARVAAPKPTLQQVADALASGQYVACSLDEDAQRSADQREAPIVDEPAASKETPDAH